MAAALLGGQTRQQDASGIQVAIGNAAGIFEIGLEEITRTGGLPPRGQKVRDQRNRPRGHEHDLLPGPRPRDIEPALTAILSEHAEEETKCALRVGAEGQGVSDQKTGSGSCREKGGTKA